MTISKEKRKYNTYFLKFNDEFYYLLVKIVILALTMPGCSLEKIYPDTSVIPALEASLVFFISSQYL